MSMSAVQKIAFVRLYMETFFGFSASIRNLFSVSLISWPRLRSAANCAAGTSPSEAAKQLKEARQRESRRMLLRMRHIPHLLHNFLAFRRLNKLHEFRG